MASITVEPGYELMILSSSTGGVWTTYYEGQTWSGDLSSNHYYSYRKPSIEAYTLYPSDGYWNYSTSNSEFNINNVKSTFVGLPIRTIQISYATNTVVSNLPSNLLGLYIAYCDNLISVSSLPSGLQVFTAIACPRLTTIPTLPESLTEFSVNADTALATVPTIPANVTNMRYCFAGCTALTGYIKINSTSVTDYTNCFKNTVSPIRLKGVNRQLLKNLASTANNGNVSVVTGSLCKVNGTWKLGDSKIKINGVWKAINKIYVKLSGVWKEGL